MPATLFAYIWKISSRHQAGLCMLSVTVFLLSAVPLELQRRIVNDAIGKGALNGKAPAAEDRAISGGVEISMILTESEHIGGFVGMSISEPLLQGGVLISVFGYLAWLNPWMALLSIAVFSPQMAFVPLMQQAMNRRGAERIQTLREVSDGIVGANGDKSGGDPAHAAAQDAQVDHVFRLNMGIFKLKFTMNFLMNLMHHLGVATVLGVGGWYAAQGRIEVGTVVAFVSGLAKVNDPWRDVVNWYREMSAVDMRYRLVADAIRGLEKKEVAPA